MTCRHPIPGQRVLDDRRGETELIAGADETDALLVRFLARFSKHTEVLPVTASTLVAALAGIWRDKRPAPAAAEATAPLRSIFVSYADADAAAARALADALTERGLDVWLDKGDSPDALQPGDTFDRIISEQIAGCELFVPVLSQRAVARVEGYFRTEWELAVERQLGIARNVAFLVPVRVDDVPKDDPGIPQVMRKRHWVEMPGGKANDAVVAHFVKTVRTVRALRKGGAT